MTTMTIEKVEFNMVLDELGRLKHHFFYSTKIMWLIVICKGGSAEATYT